VRVLRRTVTCGSHKSSAFGRFSYESREDPGAVTEIVSNFTNLDPIVYRSGQQAKIQAVGDASPLPADVGVAADRARRSTGQITCHGKLAVRTTTQLLKYACRSLRAPRSSERVA